MCQVRLHVLPHFNHKYDTLPGQVNHNCIYFIFAVQALLSCSPNFHIHFVNHISDDKKNVLTICKHFGKNSKVEKGAKLFSLFVWKYYWHKLAQMVEKVGKSWSTAFVLINAAIPLFLYSPGAWSVYVKVDTNFENLHKG